MGHKKNKNIVTERNLEIFRILPYLHSCLAIRLGISYVLKYNQSNTFETVICNLDI